MYLLLAMLGLRCCVQASSRCGAWGLLSSCSAWASHCGSFSCCRTWALGSVGWIIVCMGLVALWSFWTRNWTCVPCIGRQILNHQTTREVFYFSKDIMDGSLRMLFPASWHRDQGDLLGIFPSPSDPIPWSNLLSTSPPDLRQVLGTGRGRK